MIDDPELRQLFKAESEEHLARLDDGLLHLEKTPADQALLDEVFRESHSLKGAARMLGFSKIEAAAHGLESILNAARKGEKPLTTEVIEHMNAVLGDLRKLVQEALADEPAAAPSQASDAPSPALPRERGREQNEIHREQGKEPTLSPASGGELERGPASLFAGPTPVTEPFRIETVRVATRKLDDLLTQVGELSVIQGRVQHRLALMEELLEQWAALKRSRRGLPSARRDTEMGAPARFGDRLKEMRDALYEDDARLESVVNLLEEQVHAIRLLPLSTVFTLFPRMVRDLAKEQGKETELAVEGGEITVDKRILEEMKDPLMHLLRNAIDHGVEPPEERERAGKPRGGTVRLRAMRENNSVLLEVSDDGRGLDLEAIRRVAHKRGIHDEETLKTMTPTQLQQLIFMPGFSTSAYVTELSGRGVGLDVVRVNVERLKGSIRLESVPDQGATVQVRLPVSLATTRLLLASAGGRLYGLPIDAIRTSLRLHEEELFTLEGRPAIKLDGQPLIAPRLTDLLELPDSNPNPLPPSGEEMIGQTVCIVLQVGEELLGLRVDDLLDEEEVVVKPPGAPLLRVRNITGLAMLGSGEICAILNPADLLRSAHKTSADFRMRGAGSIPHSAINIPPSKAAILLVEDSALIRAMEKRILEDAGYEVVATVDGVDALNALGHSAFAAVVSDIVMPNMDGLTLTAHIREEPRYRDLPVILVTSLASDADKRRGLEVGANAYIPKPSFDQRVLLDTLKRLI